MGFLDEILPEIYSAIRDPGYLQNLPAEPSHELPSLRRSVEQKREQGAIVVEYKRVSPGAQVSRLPPRGIRELLDLLDPSEIAGLSCLATTPRFEGAPEQVAEFARLSRLPVLYKDFVVDPIQIEAARRTGASAVLLLARLDSEGRLKTPLAQLARLTRDAGMEVVLELHRAAELRVLLHVTADVYGVNVRDLDTLALEPKIAEETIQGMRESRPLLAMSGIESPTDADRFWRAGVDGLLVGTAVARSPDPKEFVRSLGRNSTRGEP